MPAMPMPAAATDAAIVEMRGIIPVSFLLLGPRFGPTSSTVRPWLRLPVKEGW